MRNSDTVRQAISDFDAHCRKDPELDRELAVLRAQVRVLTKQLQSVNGGGPCGLAWDCSAANFDDCPRDPSECWARMSRQQAEKEVSDASKA